MKLRFFIKNIINVKIRIGIMFYTYFSLDCIGCSFITGLQINLYLEQPMEIQLFATFFQRRK
jgi:hypothetical protein